MHHYDAKGNLLRTWGGKGAGNGQLNNPHGIWTDTRDPANPRVLVADRANVRLQYFTLDGRFLSTVDHDLLCPCHFDQRGTDLLIPDLRGRLTLFDKDNKLICHLGENPDLTRRGNYFPPEQLVSGVFYTPHQAIWDRAGNIYCVEWLKYGRVTKLRHVS